MTQPVTVCPICAPAGCSEPFIWNVCDNCTKILEFVPTAAAEWAQTIFRLNIKAEGVYIPYTTYSISIFPTPDNKHLSYCNVSLDAGTREVYARLIAETVAVLDTYACQRVEAFRERVAQKMPTRDLAAAIRAVPALKQ